MKKIFKVLNWDTSSFTTDNVENKTHWLIKALDEVLTYLDIGEFSFTYSSTNIVILETTNYGTFTIEKPGYSNGSAYVFYVNTEDKELFGCASSLVVATYDSTTLSSSNQDQGLVIRGTVKPRSATTTFASSMYGGYLALKFIGNEIIGTSSSYLISNFSTSNMGISWNSIGVILPFRNQCLASPLTPVNIKCHKAPIYRKFSNTVNDSNCKWYGEYFNGIYVTDSYYVGALRTNDGKKFVYNGYIFDVNDATDIGIITTTV
jgi:hypothetical protein